MADLGLKIGLGSLGSLGSRQVLTSKVSGATGIASSPVDSRPPVDHRANPMRIRPDPSRLLGLSFGMAKRSIKAQRCNRRDPIPWAAVEWLLSTQHSRCLDGCCRSVSSKVAGNHTPSVFSLRERFWMILAILDDIGGFWGHALFRTNPFCLDAAAFDRKPQLKLTRPSQQKSLC